jgi:hypothetical protein
MVMIEQQWRVVAELVQASETGFDQALAERLATALHELSLPRSVLERMQQAVTAAVSRSFENDTTRATCVTVLTLVRQPEDGRIAPSWGFFLVERGTGDGELYQIEMFVYPDGS